MNDGEIVEFDAGDRHLLGVVTRKLGDKYIVVTEEGDEMRPAADAIAFELGRSLDTDADVDRLESQLRQLREEIDAVAEDVDVGFLWEFVRDGGRVTPRSLCELFFESQQPLEVLATRRRLREDELYFKERGDEFEPRSESQVEQLRRQLEARRERRRRRRVFVESVTELLEADSEARAELADERMADPEFRDYAETLQGYAIHDRDFGERDEALELLEAIEDEVGRTLDGSWGEKAFELMVELGIWEEHQNLWLERYSLGGRPDEEVREAVETLDEEDWRPESWRRDLRNRRAFSIDDPETRDIDDALSCRRTGEGTWEVGIHIADPSTHIEPGDPLDRHARNRGTSIYLPTGTIPMFPERVSEEIASLVAGAERPAISVVVEFDEKGELLDHEIEPSVVHVDDRLSYEEADELIEEDESDELAEALGRLEELARVNRERRLERGAFAIDLPDPDLTVRREGGEVRVDCGADHRDSPSHELVSEFMILANTLLGKYCRERGIPVIYRAQESPDGSLDDEQFRDVPEGRPRQFAKLRRLKPGRLTTEPSSHFGLGVSAYTQATSPIRRYADLICQRQIKAHLADDGLPHDEDEVLELLGSVETTTNQAGRVQSETERYWLLEYLRRNADEVFEATVVDHKNSDGTYASVWVDAVAQKFNCNFRKSVPVGETAEVTVESADPRNDQISLRQH